MSRNLVARILVAAVAIPAILWVSYQGGWWLLGMISLFALVAISEFHVNEGFTPKGGVFWLGFGATLLLLMVLADVDFVESIYPASFLGENGAALGLTIVMLFYTVTAIIFAIGKLPAAELFKRHSRLVWGVLYVGLLYPIVFKVGGGFSDISGGDCLLFLFGVLWIGDTAAMGIGLWLGKHQLAPAVSPRKTVEGFFGGIVGAAAVGTLMYFWKFQNLSFMEVLVLAVGCSVFGQLGDLVESMWKRSLGIKDSSNIIPGHGGALDRFDSLLFAAPFMYAFFHLVRP
jgi:phosphatidate cytidylyltransferase